MDRIRSRRVGLVLAATVSVPVSALASHAISASTDVGAIRVAS
jgi:hypothetical protein